MAQQAAALVWQYLHGNNVHTCTCLFVVSSCLLQPQMLPLPLTDGAGRSSADGREGGAGEGQAARAGANAVLALALAFLLATPRAFCEELAMAAWLRQTLCSHLHAYVAVRPACDLAAWVPACRAPDALVRLPVAPPHEPAACCEPGASALLQFMEFAKVVCERLAALGHWADYIDPCRCGLTEVQPEAAASGFAGCRGTLAQPPNATTSNRRIWQGNAGLTPVQERGRRPPCWRSAGQQSTGGGWQSSQCAAAGQSVRAAVGPGVLGYLDTSVHGARLSALHCDIVAPCSAAACRSFTTRLAASLGCILDRT